MTADSSVAREASLVPVQINISAAHAGGALVLLDTGLRPATKRREVGEARVVVIVSVPDKVVSGTEREKERVEAHQRE